MKKIIPIIVIAAFLIGAYFRIWQINHVPISLFGDELDVGLQANSILTTGKDYLGTSFPVLFHSFAEYRLPMQLYMDVPFIKLFGLNEIGVRAPAVLMGFLTVFAFYLLVKELVGRKLGIIASLFITFSPWHFNFSREANDAGILLPFIIFGTYFFLKGLKNYKYFILSAILFSLSIYSYAVSSLFVPLFVLGLLIIFKREVFSYGIKKLMVVALITILLLGPYLLWTVKGKTIRRISDISVAPSAEIVARVENERVFEHGILGRLFYNKATVVTSLVFNNYMQSFSFNFLFAQGDINPRSSIDEFGEMYHFDFILVIIGVALIILAKTKESAKRLNWIFPLWLILAPIPSSLTQGGGTHAARLILMLPPLVFLSAIGFDFLTRLKRPLVRNIIMVLLILIIIFEVFRFMNRYFIVWPNETWHQWQYGFKETLQYVKGIDGNYNRVYLNSTYEPMLQRFLFWYGYDMKLFQKQFERDTFSDNIAPGFNGFKLGSKYYFGDIKKPVENLGEHGDLIVASAVKDVTNPEIFNTGKLNLLFTSRGPDGTPIFYVYFKN